METCTNINQLALSKLADYLMNLDWSYILTLILISYFIAKDELITNTSLGRLKFIARLKPFLLSITVAWRILIIGILYGIFIYWVRSYEGRDWMEKMFQSLIFAMIAHKLFLKKLMDKLDNKIFTNNG